MKHFVAVVFVGGVNLLIDYINALWSIDIFGNAFSQGILISLLAFGVEKLISDGVSELKFNLYLKKRK